MTVCVFCGKHVDPDEHATARLITGWELKRYGGGANAIHLRDMLGHFAHGECVKRAASDRKRGISPKQTAMEIE